MSEFHGKYLSMTTFKRDGTAVATPMWFVADNGHVLVETDAESGKAKRLRRDASVTIAPCNASGKVKVAPVRGRAAFLPESERTRVEGLIGRKYRLDRFLILPVYRLWQRLSHQPQGRPVVIEITPD